MVHITKKNWAVKVFSGGFFHGVSMYKTHQCIYIHITLVHVQILYIGCCFVIPMRTVNLT